MNTVKNCTISSLFPFVSLLCKEKLWLKNVAFTYSFLPHSQCIKNEKLIRETIENTNEKENGKPNERIEQEST